MQIEIDFDIFQALTALRASEADSYSDVIRRLLNLGASKDAIEEVGSVDDILHGKSQKPINFFQLLSRVPPTPLTAPRGNFLQDLLGNGAWFSNVFFPEGTQFRATYKGETYTGEIKNGCWVDQDGSKRTSPSDAAGAISGNNVNGWKFWYAKRPDDDNWVKLDELKQ